ncbi:PAS domain S-box protein [Geomesophilobacter sediminis]|uniref:histidine kinase n=1 Tax=Geomesophilobacter sediminis TaxID=2798584 RepID=A0A8J7LXL8_9BACT|nr:PAS domain S-box protein [Geomesophilobacter sediminis]MBJ6723382.1 PAS domain S-box protein [Geomesophilobacter sediminis]
MAEMSLATVFAVCGVVSALISLFYLLVFRSRRTGNSGTFCICLALANACYGLRAVCQLRAADHPLLSATSDLLYLGWIWGIWKGVDALTRRESRDPSCLVIPALAAWIVFARSSHIPFPWLSLPQHSTGALALYASGLALWQTGKASGNRGFSALSVMLWLQGISTISYPFTRNTWWAPYGFTTYVILATGIGMGLIVALLLEEEEGLLREMEARRRAEEAQRRLNRELRAVSACRQTLARAVDETALLQEICRIVCEQAGYLTAWVGYRQPGEPLHVVPEAWFGATRGFLDRLVAVGEGKEGWPAVAAVRTGKTLCLQKLDEVARYPRWREEALARDYRSGIALPLLDASGAPFGVLNIFAAEPEAFTPDEVRLLEELAGDLAFGVMLLRERGERLKTERNLALMNFALDNVHEAAYLADSGGRIIHVNEESCRMLAYSREELLARSTSDLNPALAGAGWGDLWERLQRELSVTYESAHRNRAGAEIAVEINANYVVYQGVEYGLALVRDISQRKHADETLKKLSTAIEQSPVSIVITDRSGYIEFVNPKFSQVSGYAAEEVIGTTPRKFQSGKTPPETYRDLWHTIVSGEVWQGELRNRKKDGTLFTEHMTVAPIKNHAGEITHFIGVKEDVTEKKALEAQLFQAQKMEAVGQLAGGVAHDFNNILTAIIGYGNMLAFGMELDHPQYINIVQILSAAERAAELTRSLLAFSRKQVINPRPHDLNGIVQGTERFLHRVIGEDVELSTRLHPEELAVNVDQGQIEQMLMNLATNARDAMETGGKLTITTTTAVLTQEFITANGFGECGSYACIAISDTGCGIEEGTCKRIFEPFFTTKRVGKGTGLGLAIVYGIVKQHNGYITVRSDAGKGTTFSVYLPLTENRTEGPARKEPRHTPQRGTELILIADDDAQVRDMVQQVLLQFGYQVIAARDGEDAVGKFRDNCGEIGMVILDVIMPKMNGKEALEEIERIRPGSKAIFISGYTDEIIHERGILDAGLEFVPKPLNPLHLLQKVREILDAAA